MRNARRNSPALSFAANSILIRSRVSSIERADIRDLGGSNLVVPMRETFVLSEPERRLPAPRADHCRALRVGIRLEQRAFGQRGSQEFSVEKLAARAKKRRPPYTRYAMSCWISCSSKLRDCAFER